MRTADLLVTEHIAHGILAAAGHPTARSRLLRSSNRLFLEIERFDREGPEHRRGMISLGVVDGEFVGSSLDRWATTTASLVNQGLLRNPSPTDADVARPAWEAAVAFWQDVTTCGEISAGFRAIASDNARKVAALAGALSRLPSA